MHKRRENKCVHATSVGRPAGKRTLSRGVIAQQRYLPGISRSLLQLAMLIQRCPAPGFPQYDGLVHFAWCAFFSGAGKNIV